MFIKNNIRFLRESHKLTQKDLADLVGLKSHTIIGKYEKGKANPPLEILTKISEHFGVDLQSLMFTDLEGSKMPNRVEEPRPEYGRVVKLLEKELDRLEELEQKIKANKQIMDEIRRIDPDLAKAIDSN